MTRKPTYQMTRRLDMLRRNRRASRRVAVGTRITPASQCPVVRDVGAGSQAVERLSGTIQQHCYRLPLSCGPTPAASTDAHSVPEADGPRQQRLRSRIGERLWWLSGYFLIGDHILRANINGCSESAR